MEELIKHAAGYAKLGCAVFPCHLDKTPMTPHGFKDASTDRATVLVDGTSTSEHRNCVRRVRLACPGH
jgi:hypothetical protein